MANQNPDVVALYKSLCAQQDALSTAIQNTTDPKLAATIATEIQEVAHRILLAQNLLFVTGSVALTSLVSGVKGASDQLTVATSQIQKTAGFLSSMSSYLTTVDQAIDLAKSLAVAA